MAKSKKKKKKKFDKDQYQKQRANVYTMMLIVSFMAMVLACVLLYRELDKYGFDYDAEKYRQKTPDAQSEAFETTIKDYSFV